MSKPIIVGVDPQREDESPLRLAAALSRIMQAPLVAIASHPHEISRTSAMFEADMRADAARKLEALAAGIDAELAAIGGTSPARVLHDAAVARDASLIVVGSSHRGPIGRVAPGATAERLLHGAPCPVAIANRGLAADWAPSRIGVGFIDLAEGHAALGAGAALARAAGAPLHLLTGIEPLEWGQSAVIAPYRVDGGVREWQAAAQRALDAAVAELPNDLSASTEVVVGHAADALIALSDDVDLLVCGSRGYGPLRSVLLGTVTHRLVRAARCPLVVVPRGAESTLAAPTQSQTAAAS